MNCLDNVLYVSLKIRILCDLRRNLHCNKSLSKWSTPLENCSSGNEKAPVGAGSFCPSPMLVFYIPPCRKCLPKWRNVNTMMGEGQKVPVTTGGFSHSFFSFQAKSSGKFRKCLPAWRNVKYQDGRGTKCSLPLTVESGAIWSEWQNPS